MKDIRRTFQRRQWKPREPQTRVNERIWAREVRVIGAQGEQLGVMPPIQAVAIAKDAGLDLVEVSPKANPPVCRIMDFGKFQYQKSRQERQNKSKQKKLEIKGIRLGVRTDEHDLDFKRNQVEKFLKKGSKVKIEIILRGREKAHQDLAKENLISFLKSIITDYKVEQDIKRFPGGLNVIIIPNN